MMPEHSVTKSGIAFKWLVNSAREMDDVQQFTEMLYILNQVHITITAL